MSVQWFDRERLDRIITDSIQKVDIVLDIGCGIRPQTFFQPRLHICCEPHPEYVQILKNYFWGSSNVLVIQDTAWEVVNRLPNMSVDSIFLVDFIEHIEKDEGYRLLAECERVARKQIVLFTPLGFMSQDYTADDLDGWGLHGGEWQAHKSGWTPNDFDTSWNILGCQAYHTINGRGDILEPPFGAFWAIKNIPQQENIALPVKLAVLSHILPPSPSGQATVLHRLLRNVKPHDYCLLSRTNYDVYDYIENSGSGCVPASSPRLLANYYHLQPTFQLRELQRFKLQTVFRLINILLQIIQRAKSVANVVKREKCGAILACSGDVVDLPAGYLASLWVRVPFYSYIFDDYGCQWTQGLAKRLARWVEPMILKGSSAIIVPNEFLCNKYHKQYHILSTIIRNPYEIEEIDEVCPNLWPADKNEIKIVYTGSIYHAQYDAFRGLMAGIKQLNRPQVKVHLYTAQPQKVLDRENICGPIVYHDHVALSEITRVQKQADILFLPLAFNSPISEVIKTSAPGKMAEYLASGRPILVHAPADSFVSWYFREHNCGLVVDQSDPAMIAQAIRQLCEDVDLRQKLKENAQARAKADFSVAAARAEFLKILQLTGRR